MFLVSLLLFVCSFSCFAGYMEKMTVHDMELALEKTKTVIK